MIRGIDTGTLDTLEEVCLKQAPDRQPDHSEGCRMRELI